MWQKLSLQTCVLIFFCISYTMYAYIALFLFNLRQMNMYIYSLL